MPKVDRKLNAHFDNQNQIKPPKKENGLTKLFHSIKKTWDSLFSKPLSDQTKPLSDRKIEIEEVFGPEEEVIIERKLELTEFVIGIKQPTKDIELEIDILLDRSDELQEQIIAEEKSDPWRLRGMVGRILGKDKLTILKADKQIIDDLIESKRANLRKRLDNERGDLPEDLELEEISDEEIELK